LVVSAHPDDAEMAMGGTLVKLVQTGRSVMHVSLTDGSAGTYGSLEERKAEFEAAAKVIGCDCRMLEFVDTEINNDSDSRKRVAALIRELKPKVVFAPYHTNALAEPGGIAHVDHYTAGALVRDAVKFARLKGLKLSHKPHEIENLFFYMLPRDKLPSIVVDVSESMEQAFEAIEKYSSQMAIQFRGLPIREILKSMRQAAGFRYGMQYAETFVTDMPLRFDGKTFFEV